MTMPGELSCTELNGHRCGISEQVSEVVTSTQVLSMGTERHGSMEKRGLGSQRWDRGPGRVLTPG